VHAKTLKLAKGENERVVQTPVIVAGLDRSLEFGKGENYDTMMSDKPKIKIVFKLNKNDVKFPHYSSFEGHHFGTLKSTS